MRILIDEEIRTTTGGISLAIVAGALSGATTVVSIIMPLWIMGSAMRPPTNPPRSRNDELLEMGTWFTLSAVAGAIPGSAVGYVLTLLL